MTTTVEFLSDWKETFGIGFRNPPKRFIKQLRFASCYLELVPGVKKVVLVMLMFASE